MQSLRGGETPFKLGDGGPDYSQNLRNTQKKISNVFRAVSEPMTSVFKGHETDN